MAIFTASIAPLIRPECRRCCAADDSLNLTYEHPVLAKADAVGELLLTLADVH
jgi:hypothetical protein